MHGDKITIHCATTDHFRNPWGKLQTRPSGRSRPQLRRVDADSQLPDAEHEPVASAGCTALGFSGRWRWASSPRRCSAPWFETHRLCSVAALAMRRSSCLSKTTEPGYSRGAIAVNALEDDAGVAHIDVFGMNWNGHLAVPRGLFVPDPRRRVAARSARSTPRARRTTAGWTSGPCGSSSSSEQAGELRRRRSPRCGFCLAFDVDSLRMVGTGGAELGAER